MNEIFSETGLSFTLTEEKIVERVIEYGVLSSQVINDISTVSERGIRDLLNEAICLCKTPNPSARSGAVEKLWDAFERLKTYYTTLGKKKSAAKIVSDMSGGEVAFSTMFDEEFKVLTYIGNN
jgi:ABC-type uncharacterized transport system YnjBCD substrate-binding protein